MSDEMRPAEALALARKMTRHFAAFEKLEEVLQVATSVDARLPGLVKQRDDLTEEVEKLRQKRDDARRELEQFQKRVQTEMRTMASEHTSEKQRLTKERRSVEHEIAAKQREAEEAAAKAKKAHDQFLEQARKEQREAEAALAGLRADIEGVKQRLEGV